MPYVIPIDGAPFRKDGGCIGMAPCPAWARLEDAAPANGGRRPEGRGKEDDMADLDKEAVVGLLNRILEAELAGVVRYTHYSFLVFGFGRIPIVSWLNAQADESMLHARQAGEWITTLGAYPSLAIGALLDSHKHDIGAMLRESLQAEGEALELYRKLLAAVEGRSVALEEYARQMVYVEELHAAEVDKMLRKPGDVSAFAPRPN
jgi:bacterioferritin